MILCYACRKQLADTALACPKCGAAQTPEGREKGRQMKKGAETFALIVALLLAVPLFLCCFGVTSSSSDHEAELRAMVARGMEKAKSEGMQFLQSKSLRVQIVTEKTRATVTFQDSGIRARPNWGPDLTEEDLRWETTYEMSYIYDGKWKLIGGKTKSKDKVVLDQVPLSLSNYFDP